MIENWDGWYLATFLAAILRAHFLLGCHEHDSEPDKIKTIVDNLNGAVVCLGEPGSRTWFLLLQCTIHCFRTKEPVRPVRRYKRRAR